MISRRRLLVASLFGMAAFSAQRTSAMLMAENPLVPSAPPKKLECFDYRGVTLSPSMLKAQYEQTRTFYLNLSNGDILKSL